jgi:hypothetical protein
MEQKTRRKRQKIEKKILTAIAVFLLLYPFQKAAAESAGELGRHYGVRYTMPIIIGPLRDLRQGKLPPPAILERPETADVDSLDAEPGDGDAYTPFNPDLDFDEPLYADFTADSLTDLYALLHKKGSRVSYKIYPLMKVPLEEVRQRVKPQAKKQVGKVGKASAENKKRQRVRR